MEEPQGFQVGPYRLTAILGRGGMGEVYKAWDQRLERWVAIKHLLGPGDTATRERFRREAKTAAGLGHPGIVQVFDIVEDDGDWIVMELVDGSDFAELLRDGPLDVDLALDYGRQVASALDAAHRAGVVHRDLKTENVMLLPSGNGDSDRARPGRSRPGHVKVLDFGLAKATLPSDEGDDGALSAPGRAAGTPRAMSPEQARGEDVDARSDLFSLGVLLYELVTARSPFRARTADETLTRVLTHRQPPARNFDPRIPAELSGLVDHLLEKDRQDRPGSAAEVAKALERIAAAQLVGPDDGDELFDETFYESSLEGEIGIRTLLLSDLVGSTRLVESLGEKSSASLFRRHDRVARDLLAEHGGREIDKTDASLAARERRHSLMLFERPWSALRYALDYHEALRRLSQETGVTVTSRVGIHLGEVILLSNSQADVARGAKPLEVEGLAKPTAARLMSLAGGGQTLLTRAAFEMARRGADGEEAEGLEWMAHGRYRFKGIDDDLEVFEVGARTVAPLTAPADSAKARRVEPVEPSEEPTACPVAVLRTWPPPELPEHPYPVLLPYTHPALMAGREQELAELRVLLRRPIPILGLQAPSGTGKSSFLLGGLVPELRGDEEAPGVALIRHPQEAGIVGRLLGDLLDGGPRHPPPDDDWHGFAERLEEVSQLSGVPPVLVVDQFEEVLRPPATRARAVLGALLAASARRRPGTSEPLCRWLLAYRQEFYGALVAWLGDVLHDARAAEIAGIEALPDELTAADRFHSMTLLPLATTTGGGDALAAATLVFQAAIERPLLVRSPDGGKLYPYRFAPGQAERLARIFAQARLDHPDAPLAPEIQVTLAHLLARAGADGEIELGADTSELIGEALEAHLRRALEAAFPPGAPGAAARRARALLALRELATAAGPQAAGRNEGLPASNLAKAIGTDGERILRELATPQTRLVVFRDAPEGLRCVLSHDSMAAAVVRLVEEGGGRGDLLVDDELLALRRFVALKTAHHRSRDPQATRLPWRHYRRLAAHAEALLWDEERRAWWAACRKQRRADRWRQAASTAAMLLVLLLVAAGVSLGVWQVLQGRRLLEMLAHGAPPVALMAFDRMAAEDDADPAELLALLRRRDDPKDVLDASPAGLGGDDASRWLLRFVEALLPWVEETPDDPELLAPLLRRLDFFEAPDPRLVLEARGLRERLLEPLQRLRPPPAGGADGVEIPAGDVVLVIRHPDMLGDFRQETTVDAFRMLRHEVTAAEFRRLWPDYPPGGDDLPAIATWYRAYTYAAWLGGRLPTEAEWEHAARAGCPTLYCRANGEEATLDEVAWWAGNSRDTETGVPSRQPVMRRAPNPWGLYDMVGNTMEWTETGWVARGSSVVHASWMSDHEFRELHQRTAQHGIRVVFPSPNVAPAISLRAPASGSTLPSGRDVPLAADAFDVDGTVVRVRFSADRGAGPELLGEVSAAPYSPTWTNAADGCYVVRAEAVDDGGKTATAVADVVVGSCPQGPRYGGPAAIPGRIEAGDFDLGLKGEAYFDTTPGNSGGACRHGTDVDLQISEDFGGGCNVGWIAAGEWMEYTIDVAAAGDYDLYARVASYVTGGTFHVEFKGVDKTGPMTVPVTGGWQTWETISATVRLDAGVQVMRWQNASEFGEYNLGHFTLVAAGDRFCGDDACEPGESCVSCPIDCAGLRRGPKHELFCCGNGVAELPEGDGAVCDGNS